MNEQSRDRLMQILRRARLCAHLSEQPEMRAEHIKAGAEFIEVMKLYEPTSSKDET